jgi:TonB family protein
MAGFLLYQPRKIWGVGVAFGAAALIHFAAVAIASIHHNTQMEEITSQDEFPIVDLIDPASPNDEPTPRPDDMTAPSPIPNPADESMFPEDRPTPAPVRRKTTRFVVPIVKARNATTGSLSLSSAKAMALSAPRPEYPYEARRQKITGNGVVVMTVDSVSGNVTDVSMWQSTGSPVLDNATVAAFRRWRFKPGTVSRVKSPITFTMTGAQY